MMASIYAEFFSTINEILSDGGWGIVLLQFCFLFFLFGIKAYAQSPIRHLGTTAYIFAIAWATIVPVLAFPPIAGVAFAVVFAMLALLKLSGLAIILTVPAIAVFGISSIIIVCSLLAVPEYLAKKAKLTKPTTQPT